MAQASAHAQEMRGKLKHRCSETSFWRSACSDHSAFTCRACLHNLYINICTSILTTRCWKSMTRMKDVNNNRLPQRCIMHSSHQTTMQQDDESLPVTKLEFEILFCGSDAPVAALQPRHCNGSLISLEDYLMIAHHMYACIAYTTAHEAFCLICRPWAMSACSYVQEYPYPVTACMCYASDT